MNTRDRLSKFAQKADNGYFVGYSSVSKAYRVFNRDTNMMDETPNITFFENSFPSTCMGPDWLFDVESFMKSFDVSYSSDAGKSDTTFGSSGFNSSGGVYIL